MGTYRAMRLAAAIVIAAALAFPATTAAAIKPAAGLYLGKAGSATISFTYKAGAILHLKVGSTLVAAKVKVSGAKFTAKRGAVTVSGKWISELIVEGTVRRGAAKAASFQASWGP